MWASQVLPFETFSRYSKEWPRQCEFYQSSLPNPTMSILQMVEKLEESSGSQMDVCPVLSEATLSTVSEAALGYSIQDLDANLVDYNERML